MSPAENQMRSTDRQNQTVLVVEDEVLLRLTLAEDLRDRGFAVIEAASADEARKLALAGVPFDLVISDITMPGEIDGSGLAQWLADNDVPAVVMLTSGLPTALDKARAMLPNVKAFIAKPYDHEKLLVQIEAMLKRED
ncbi:MAG TPA: response regulator [Vitreimonas sp.]|uniref:response regulator n=1 Tax=Vitreimonas sp. TaxID=3069702 RepID=UPI002D4FDC33|nr:response regulator [Vitreimonas sp.]HYD86210.1 response regulator [Vitreimonas sp.]